MVVDEEVPHLIIASNEKEFLNSKLGVHQN